MSATKRNSIATCYWIGVAMIMTCLALILAGNTELAWRFEHQGFPLSWAFAGAGILAFLAAEFWQSAFPLPIEAEDPSGQLAPELESAES